MTTLPTEEEVDRIFSTWTNLTNAHGANDAHIDFDERVRRLTAAGNAFRDFLSKTYPPPQSPTQEKPEKEEKDPNQ